MSQTLTHETFVKHLGHKFQVQVERDNAIDLELTQVSELEQSPRHEQFTIVFRGPNEAFLGQGTQQIVNEEMGHFDIFLVPISQDDQGYYYEAVFNRLREQAETAS